MKQQLNSARLMAGFQDAPGLRRLLVLGENVGRAGPRATKAVETKAVESKAAESKAVEAKPVETKAVEAKADKPASAEAKPAAESKDG